MNTLHTGVPRFLLFFLSLLLAFLLLGQTASADPVKIINGYASPNDAAPGTPINIWADPTLQWDYDDDKYVYLFHEWTVENTIDDGYQLNILANRYAEQTSFIYPSGWIPRFIAEFYAMARPGPPTNVYAYGIPNGVEIHWSAPTFGPALTEYLIYDGYNYYSAAPGDDQHNITGMANGETRSFSISAISDVVSSKPVNFQATAGPPPIQIHYDPANGTAAFTLQAYSGMALAKPADPVYAEHEFLGWYYAYDTTIPVTFNQPFYDNQYFVARWKDIAKESFTVTFDSQGGSDVPEQKVEKNKVLVAPTEPQREGYQFGGWFLDGKRFDLASPITGDLTLTAYWTALCPAYDLSQLIGEPGQLDGVLSQAIGLSGSYDPAVFQVSLGPLYPSIQFTLRDVPDAAIIFSNPPRLRYQQSADRLQNYALRFSTNNHFAPFRQAVEIQVADDNAEVRELTYTLQLSEQSLLARDFITAFKSSEGLIHVRYPAEEEDYVLEQLNALLQTVQTTEGVRPAIAQARFDGRQTDALSTADLLYRLGRLDQFLDQEDSLDRRLNAELLEQAYAVAVADVQAFEALLLSEDLTEDDLLDLEADQPALAALGVELNLQPEDEEKALTLRVLPADFFARAKDWLPEDDASLLEFLELKQETLFPVTDPTTADAWTEHMLAYTELAIMVGDCPAWNDPLYPPLADQLARRFESYLQAHLGSDGQANPELQASYASYLQATADLELRLPAQVFEKRIGVYWAMVRNLSQQITAKGGALTQAELTAFLQEANPRNQPVEEE